MRATNGCESRLQQWASSQTGTRSLTQDRVGHVILIKIKIKHNTALLEMIIPCEVIMASSQKTPLLVNWSEET
jgi:hypothetical protein